MSHQLPSYLTITRNPTQILQDLIAQWKPDLIAVLVDENTKEHCLPKIALDAQLICEIKSGERYKNLESCSHVWSELTKSGFTRKSLLLNLGGGVIGDMGGFIASTFKRGIRFINLPTTLLSQVDASIGGKLGIDFNGLKNHIGLFREPDHVIVNPDFLRTLSDREIKSGFAEVIKHALIADKEQWNFLLDTKLSEIDWNSMIPKSIEIKNKVVLDDPTEKGYRKILNFGHTLGHAIESYLLESDHPLLHGEAIAIGMILESHLAYQQGWLNRKDLASVTGYIQSIYNPAIRLPQFTAIQSLLKQDKKNDELGISFSLIDGIGGCNYDVRVTDTMIQNSMIYFEQLNE